MANITDEFQQRKLRSSLRFAVAGLTGLVITLACWLGVHSHMGDWGDAGLTLILGLPPTVVLLLISIYRGRSSPRAPGFRLGVSALVVIAALLGTIGVRKAWYATMSGSALTKRRPKWIPGSGQGWRGGFRRNSANFAPSPARDSRSQSGISSAATT